MEKPGNELGVLALFAQRCQRDGWEIVSVQVGFPDLVIREGTTGKEYKAELEYNATNFKAHRHDPRKCDLIICWENDWPDCPMTIWALSGKQEWAVRVLPEAEREILQLRMENEALRNDLRVARSNLEAFKSEPAKSYRKTLVYPRPCPYGCEALLKSPAQLSAHGRWCPMRRKEIADASP